VGLLGLDVEGSASTEGAMKVVGSTGNAAHRWFESGCTKLVLQGGPNESGGDITLKGTVKMP
jgi:hypothetical protein